MPKATSSKPTGVAPVRAASSNFGAAIATGIETGIAVVGIDIGKDTFHVVALDRRGRVVLQDRAVTQPAHGTARQHEALPDRHGGVRRRAHSGAPACGLRAHDTADAGQICMPLRQGLEGRLQRIRGDRGSRAATDDDSQYKQVRHQ